MLNCKLTRGQLTLNSNDHPKHDIRGIIGLMGALSGTVIVSLDQQVALSATGAMLGETPESMDENVIDAVGELANMIAGSAKSTLEHLDIKLALPTVISGRNHNIAFGSVAQSICIPYTCDWGALSVEVGFAPTDE